MTKDEQSFQFSQKYASDIERYEAAIYDTAAAIGGTGVRWLKKATKEEIEEKIQLCNACIEAFETFKKFCYGKSKGGGYYFEEMWNKLHNSKKPCFSYIDSVLEQKRDLIQALNQK